jgi:hypothetical protein
MLVVSKAAVIQAPEAFDACSLITGEKEAVPIRVKARGPYAVGLLNVGPASSRRR